MLPYHSSPELPGYCYMFILPENTRIHFQDPAISFTEIFMDHIKYTD